MSAMKTSTNTSIVAAAYVGLFLIICVDNLHRASAWSGSRLSSSSSIASLTSSSSSSSSSSSPNAVIGSGGPFASPTDDAFGNRRRRDGSCFSNISQITARSSSNESVGEVVASLSLDYDSGEEPLPSSSSSSSSVSSVDVNRDNSGRSSTDALEEESFPFMGVGRLYHDPTSKPTDTETPIDITQRLKKSTVAVVGIGGVGSWATEALVRSGVGNIVLVDLDDICVSNTNRQVHTTSRTIGRMKTEEMKRRLLEIHPACNVTIVHDFISVDNAYTVVQNLLPDVDVLLDAIDGAAEKAALVAAACVHSLPVVTCGGAAGRIDPTKIVCDDLTKCADCRLLFSVKKRLRNDDRYRLFTKGPTEDGDIKRYRPRKWRIWAVFSTELQKKVGGGEEEVSSLRRCDGELGTACFVTGTYGFVAAGKVVEMIVHRRLLAPRVLRSSVERIKQEHRERHSV